uniref:Hyaluronidase n=1 Tax=Sinocyclocheilus grahami TaxID=75366 RepID=A0A672P9C9_SINGR
NNEVKSSMLQKHMFILLSLSLLFLLLCLFTRPCVCGPARAPLLAGQPFLVLWGVPDKDCLGRPDPAAFGMEWEGRVAIFYEDTLGLYPYFTAQDHPVNGGLPQHTSLDIHLQRVEGDLMASLPQAGAPGLGVLRWQEWAPQWNRNRGIKTKDYHSALCCINLCYDLISCQVDFEAAAQSIMMETLREVKRLRPQRLWGIAPYPNCYNFDSTQIALANYTGRCPAAEMALNDELMWLWKRSGALYPALSLEKLPEGTKGAWLYATNRIREALRVAALAGTTFDLPVFPLIKIVYTSSSSFLSEIDLVNTIGESAAMGASGVIIWEKSLAVKTQVIIQSFLYRHYHTKVLGPYAVNVTTAARLCGVSLCQGRGRCVRKKPEDPTYLHLPSAHFMLLPNGAEGVRATGELPTAYIDRWKKDFRCQWFEALEGAAADQESGVVLENRGKITSPTVKTVVGISPSQSTVVPVIQVTVVPTKQPVDAGNSALITPIILLSSLVLHYV